MPDIQVYSEFLKLALLNMEIDHTFMLKGSCGSVEVVDFCLQIDKIIWQEDIPLCVWLINHASPVAPSVSLSVHFV